MLPEVVWMSQASAEVYEPGEREACVSIRDPAVPLPGLSGVSRSPSLAAGLLVAHGRWAEPDRIVNSGVYQRILGACARRLGARRRS